MKFLELALLLQMITACTYGGYLVELRVISYTNPSNWCAECSTSSPFEGQFGCCEDFDEQDCQGIYRCDNYFRYCLREFGTIDQITQLRASDQPTGCLSGTLIQSNFPDEVDFNTDTDFSGSQVLGLANPLPLFGQGNQYQWQGIQVYIEPMDFDENSSDDTIDILTIDLPPSIEPGSSGNDIQLTGRFGIAIMNISYQVKCQQFFYGNFCENYDNCMAERVICQNGGTCRDLENDYQCECTPGYFGQFCEEIDNCFGVNCSNRGQCRNGICECDPGYTGGLCETEVNKCLGVDCNGRGTCENRVNSFFCTCDQGYTGPLCETDIDDCEGVTCSGNGQCIDGVSTFTCLCDQGFTGSVCDTLLEIINTKATGSGSDVVTGNIPWPALGGGIAGGILIIVLIVIAIILVACVLRREDAANTKTEEQPPSPYQNGYHAYGQDNPVYGAPMGKSYTSSTNSTSTGLNSSSYSQPDLNRSDEQIYSEPMYHTASRESEEERDFENPLYRSSEDITSSEAESSRKVFSFIRSTDSYLSSLHENELIL